ncbi:hypothetical protein D3C80_223430 [compost metagenome]
MKHHILYKTTCSMSGKFYYGIHTTDDLDDGYLGSGIYIKRSIAKYGRAAHTRVVIASFDTREEMVLAECELVTTDLMTDPMCMNMKIGGLGGWSHVTVAWNKGLPFSAESRMKMSAAHTGKVLSEEHRAALTAELTERWKSPAYKAKLVASMTAYYACPDARRKMSIAVSDAWSCPVLRSEQSTRLKAVFSDPKYKQIKSDIANEKWADPEFRARQKLARTGQKWMKHPIHGSTKVKPDDIAGYLANGWIMGRDTFTRTKKVRNEN